MPMVFTRAPEVPPKKKVLEKVPEDEWNDLLDDEETDAWLQLFDNPIAMDYAREHLGNCYEASIPNRDDS